MPLWNDLQGYGLTDASGRRVIVVTSEPKGDNPIIRGMWVGLKFLRPSFWATDWMRVRVKTPLKADDPSTQHIADQANKLLEALRE